MRQDCVRLDGMTFYGYHGVRPEERTLGQRFLVDLALYRDVAAAAASDDLADATNYAAIFATVRAIAEAGVDFISVGALTHSAPALDLGLDIRIHTS